MMKDHIQCSVGLCNASLMNLFECKHSELALQVYSEYFLKI
jgi:hypothetical protein